jgi:hypothetical protein
VEFSADMVLSSDGILGDAGPQGWTVSVWHAGVDIVSLSVEGTVSATESEGGFVADRDEGDEFSGGFVFFDTIDPQRNQGREGVVQAVVLAIRRPVTLPPNTHQITGRIFYRTRVGPTGRIAFVRHEDGLVGPAQPVLNIVTFRGESEFPSLDHREITIGDGAVPETGRCDDGIDNDEDGWPDCFDPECGSGGACGVEVCRDGVDNDGDGVMDCDDSDCRGTRSCREFCIDGVDNDFDGRTDCDDRDCQSSPVCRESCTDSVDNDSDGRTDCEDSDCASRDSCPPLEHCSDSADNDADGLTYCDDPDCLRAPLCRVPEDCDDGLDNDLDGSADCDDRNCFGFGSCPGPEDCEDGADNDRDGRVDCDDRDCFGVGRCPAPEVCDDGLDNDRDGLTDCDDRDCSSLTVCREREDCRDGIDNDIDGRIDCDDRDCAGLPPCPPQEVCDGGADEDGDGLVDCADPSCEGVSPCGGGEGFDFVLFTDGAVREASDGGGAGGMHQTNVVDVSFASEASIEVTVYIVPFPGPQPDGAQGWSLSIAHNREALRIESATIQGTDAAAAIQGGFTKTEVADDPSPGGGAGGDEDAEGFVSAVVVTFTQPITLDPTRAQSVARATYRLRDSLGAAGIGPGTIAFDDGLRGSGQPVRNVLTINGQTVIPLHFYDLEVRRIPGNSFVRGDPNADGRVDLADAVWCVSELMRGGRSSPCPRAADINRDSRYDLSDPIFLAMYLFLQGRVIPTPFPSCGTDGETAFECPEGAVSYCP